MTKKIIISLMIIFAGFAVCRFTKAQAQFSVDVYFFYQEGCPYCAQMKLFLADLIKRNPNVKVNAYDMADKNNQELFLDFVGAYGTSTGGSPMLFIGDKVIEGNYPIEVENAVNNCLALRCISPRVKLANYIKNNNISNSDSSLELLMNLRWVIIITALIFIGGIVISFNRKK
ncbi:MAG: hypothetical protein V1655_02610 [bacterium]